MAPTISRYYLLCQIFGWSILTASHLVIMGMYGYPSHLAAKLFLFIFPGLISTHLLRNAILIYRWLTLPFRKGLVRLSLGIVFACILAGIIRYLGNSVLIRSLTPLEFFAPPQLLLENTLDCGIVIIPWGMIYILYAYAQRTRKDNLERRHLEGRINEMKQRSDEMALDVDSIINSLREIRSTIDQDPNHARDEITKFSKLLRQGYFKS
jgi:hypothetical protein